MGRSALVVRLIEEWRFSLRLFLCLSISCSCSFPVGSLVVIVGILLAYRSLLRICMIAMLN